MPHASVKLRPGVDQNETPTLNEAGISTSNLIRFIYDQAQGALVQKLGGWTKYFPNTTPAIVRALWAWEDTQSVAHLAYGTEDYLNATPALTTQLAVITNGNSSDITPKFKTENIAPVATTVIDDSYVTITSSISGITTYDSVYIATQISIGGLVLFGLYQCDPNNYIGTYSYQVQATNILGVPTLATSSSSSPVLPTFSVTINNPVVTVSFPNHGYSLSSTFPVLVSTNVGGVVFLGNYPVQSIIDADSFTITSPTLPTSTTTGTLNGGLAQFTFSYGIGAIPTGTGYGILTYGEGGYGTGTAVSPTTGDNITALDWTLDNWGEVLLACPINEIGTAPPFQPIYEWDAIGGAPFASVIPQAPPVNDGFFVAMPQRQIIAWGSTFNGIPDPLLIRWCDVNNYNDWSATLINQAGSYRLPKGSRIVGCIQGPQQGFLWTDLGVWSVQYIGPPYVYAFNEIGSGCGMISRKAAASINGVTYWMGPSQFFSLTEQGVQPVACPIWDVIFQNLDQTNLNKIRVAVNSRFGEITWYYPTIDSHEVNAYAKYNVLLKTWDFGSLGRSAWVDQSVLGPPIGSDPTSKYIYQHETSSDADGAAMNSSFQTGYFSMSDADVLTFVDQVWPDMKWGYYNGTQNANVNITFNVANYPGDTPTVYGPYTVIQSTQYITPRFRGRLVSINLSSNDVGSFWRIGNIRYRLQQDGKF